MKELLAKSLVKYQNRIAYKCGDRSVTFGDLYNGAVKMSEELSQQGSGPVVLYGHKEVEMIKAIVACIFAGRAYVPVDVSLPRERVEDILRQSGATYVINTGEKRCQAINISEDNSAYKETAYIIFTSGSTGRPKGIPISYDNLKNFCKWQLTLDGFKDACMEVVFNQANLNFDLSVAALFFCLLNGHTMISLEKEEQSDYESLYVKLLNEKITFMVLTPSFLSILLANPDFNEINYPKLKCIYLCGEVFSKKKAVKTLERFPDMILINAYGPTEATSAVSAVRVTNEMIEKYDTLAIGKLDNTAASISLEDGEIVLGGPSVFSGYTGNISGGYERREGINYYKTGDLGYIKDDLLFFLGRSDFQIKYKGYRIELEEIENVIANIAGVKECVVVPKRDPEGNVLFLKAYVTAALSSVDDIKARAKERIPDYMIPKTIKIIDKMPVNSNGKLDRKALLYD